MGEHTAKCLASVVDSICLTIVIVVLLLVAMGVFKMKDKQC